MLRLLPIIGLVLVGCRDPEPVRSSDWLATIPDSPEKRQVILGCTPCHPIGPPVAHRTTRAEWDSVVVRMKQIDDDLDLALIPMEGGEIAAWLDEHDELPRQGRRFATATATHREYSVGPLSGFYHDIAIAGGRAWVADYFGDVLYGVDPNSGEVIDRPLPVRSSPAGAHALDVDVDGALWMTFTKSEEVIRYDTATDTFRVYGGFVEGGNVQYFVLDAQRNVYRDETGGVWVSHFSKEVLSRLDPDTGEISVYRTPRTEALIEKGVHLYAAVADSQGRIWYTETHGNRYGMLDPRTGDAQEWEMPEPWSGPKRLAIDPEDILWIPELTTGHITSFDTRSMSVTARFPLPITGEYPYAIRRNPYDGTLWGTGPGSDVLYRYNGQDFDIYRLPRRGSYSRTIAFEPGGSVWISYASFPGWHTQSPLGTGGTLRLTP